MSRRTERVASTLQRELASQRMNRVQLERVKGGRDFERGRVGVGREVPELRNAHEKFERTVAENTLRFVVRGLKSLTL